MKQEDFQPGASGTRETASARLLTGRSARELDARQLIEALHALRRSPVDADFWSRYCALAAPLARARLAVVLTRQAQADWQWLASSEPEFDALPGAWRDGLPNLSERALDNGFAYAPLRDDRGVNHLLACVRLGERHSNLLLLLLIPEQERARLNELLLRVQLVADLPVPEASAIANSTAADSDPGAQSVAAPVAAAASISIAPSSAVAASTGPERDALPAGADDVLLTELLDLSTLVMREKQYGAAGIALVNGLMARLGCALVALGWRQDGYVRIEAISHLDRFERKTEYVNLLESACEEAADQGCDIMHGGGDADAGLIVQAHVRLQRVLGYSQICTAPLHAGGDAPKAVLLLAMEQGELSLRTLNHVHLSLELILPWLLVQRERDRWLGARFGSWLRGRLTAFLGPERPFAKVFSLSMVALLFYAVFGVQTYRIEATSQLGTDSTRLISATYDGFLNQVNATSGDSVKQGMLLAALDTRELIQQEAETQADIQRYRAEAMKARASLSLADAEIAQRRLAQVEARLKRIRYSLTQSRVYAPFDSVIVEGERKDLLGAPVKKGDRLFRLARIEGLYVVLHVPENEIRHVDQRARGELTLLARPDTRIPFEVETLMPIAQVKGQDGNHFVIKARLLSPPESWWRPGMSGMARINAGERNVAWIYTHKAIDAVRMMFWF